MGNDWEGRFDNLNKICKVIYLSRTDEISTTLIIDKISNRFKSVEQGGDFMRFSEKKVQQQGKYNIIYRDDTYMCEKK